MKRKPKLATKERLTICVRPVESVRTRTVELTATATAAGEVGDVVVSKRK